MVIDESNLVQERVNAQITTEAILLQLAAGSILSTKVGKAFTKTLNGLAKEAVVRDRSGESDGS